MTQLFFCVLYSCMQDPFVTFDLPRRYAIDLDDLQQRFVRLSAEHHPDRFSDPMEQAEAADRIAQINEAHAMLKDPVRRARTLVNLIENQNAREGDDASASNDDLPPDFLMEVMEIRETMEQAIENDDQAKLDELRRWAQSERQSNLEKIAAAFDTHLNSVTTDTTPDALVGDVRQRLNVMRYLDRMLEQMPG